MRSMRIYDIPDPSTENNAYDDRGDFLIKQVTVSAMPWRQSILIEAFKREYWVCSPVLPAIAVNLTKQQAMTLINMLKAEVDRLKERQ